MKTFIAFLKEDTTTTANMAIVDKPLAVVKRKNESNTYDYGSLQCAIPKEISRLIKLYIRQNFNELEDEPHITIKYGLSELKSDKIFEFIKTIIGNDTIKIKIGDIDCFENESEGFVYHFKVDCDLLHILHNEIKDNFENIETYDEYKPHITLAYEQEKCNMSKNLLKGIEFDINTIQYSSPDGTIAEYKI